MAVLGLRFCARAFSSCGERGPLFIAVRGPLTIAASLVAEHRLRRCGSRAQLLRGMWDLPRPGLEPVSPALAGGLSTTAPPGKPDHFDFNWETLHQARGQNNLLHLDRKGPLRTCPHSTQGLTDEGKYHSWHWLEYQTPRWLCLIPDLSISIKEYLSYFRFSQNNLFTE